MIIERLISEVKAEKLANDTGKFLYQIKELPLEKLIDATFTEYAMYLTLLLDRSSRQSTAINTHRQHVSWMREEIVDRLHRSEKI